MNSKVLLLAIIGVLLGSAIAGILFQNQLLLRKLADSKMAEQVLGTVSENRSTSQTHFDTIVSPIGSEEPAPTKKPSLLPFSLPFLSSEHYVVDIVSAPTTLTEGEEATFTWTAYGGSKTIHTTTVYYGTTSSPEVSAFDTTPQELHYTDWLKNFIHGDYKLPLQFIESVRLEKAGTYYYRAYALIDGKHYWSTERLLIVKPQPKQEINVVNYPTKITSSDTPSFTWDITGPSAVANFTSIVVSNRSKPGALDSSVDVSQTPYEILINDFISGTYNVPLRFVGNSQPLSPGVYFFRALARINGKNIWSGEYSFTVE